MGLGEKEQPKSLEDVLQEIDREASGDDAVGVRDVLEAFGSRTFGPLLTLPAVVAVSPIGAIPTAPTILGVFVVLVGSQHAIGLKRPWIPRRLLDRSVSKERWESARSKTRTWVRRIDSVIKPRLTGLTTGSMDRVAAIAAVLLGAMMPPLELLPFAVYAPGFALLCLGLAMTARDGTLAILAYTLTAGSGVLVYMAIG